MSSVVEIVLQAVDRASPAFEKVAGEAEGLSASAKTAGIAMLGLAAGAGVVAIGLGKVAEMGADFQRKMLEIGNNTNMSTAQIGQMHDAVLQLGMSTGQSFDRLGEGFMHAQNLTQNYTASLAETTVANKAAIATGDNVANTTNTLAAAMHEYGLDVSHAATQQGQFAEITKNANWAMGVMHLATSEANTTLDQWSEKTARATGIAANLGVALPDVSAALATLTKHGFPDLADAQTQVVNIMTHMVHLTKSQSDEVTILSQKSGVDLVRDFSAAGLASKGLSGVMDEVRLALDKSGLSTAEQSKAVMQLWNAQRGGLGALALLNVGLSDYHTILGDLNDQTKVNTITEEQYQRTIHQAPYQWDILKQTIHGTAIMLGEQMLPTLSLLMQRISPLIERVTAWARAHERLIGPILATTAIVAGFVAVVAGIAGVVLLASAALGPLVGIAASLAVPVGAAALAGVALHTAWDHDWLGIRDRVHALTSEAEALGKATGTWIRDTAVPALKGLKDIVEGTWTDKAPQVAQGLKELPSGMSGLTRPVQDVTIAIHGFANEIVTLGQSAANWLTKNGLPALGALKDLVVGSWSGNIDQVAKGLGGLPPGLSGLAGPAVDVTIKLHDLADRVVALGQAGANWLTQNGLPALSALKDLITGTWGDDIDKVAKGLGKLPPGLSGLAGPAVAATLAVQKLWDQFKRWASPEIQSAWTDFKTGVPTGVADVKTQLDGLRIDFETQFVPSLKGAWPQISQAFDLFKTDLKTGIPESVQQLKDFATEVNTLVTDFSTLGVTIHEFVYGKQAPDLKQAGADAQTWHDTTAFNINDIAVQLNNLTLTTSGWAAAAHRIYAEYASDVINAFKNAGTALHGWYDDLDRTEGQVSQKMGQFGAVFATWGDTVAGIFAGVANAIHSLETDVKGGLNWLSQQLTGKDIVGGNPPGITTAAGLGGGSVSGGGFGAGAGPADGATIHRPGSLPAGSSSPPAGAFGRGAGPGDLISGLLSSAGHLAGGTLTSAMTWLSKPVSALVDAIFSHGGVGLSLPGALGPVGPAILSKTRDEITSFVTSLVDQLRTKIAPPPSAGGTPMGSYSGGNALLDLAMKVPGAYMWCEKFIGDVMQAAGLHYSRFPTAAAHAGAQPLNPGFGPPGSIEFLPWDGDGHVAFNVDGKGLIYGTANTPTGTGYMQGWAGGGWTLNPAADGLAVIGGPAVALLNEGPNAQGEIAAPIPLLRQVVGDALSGALDVTFSRSGRAAHAAAGSALTFHAGAAMAAGASGIPPSLGSGASLPPQGSLSADAYNRALYYVSELGNPSNSALWDQAVNMAAIWSMNQDYSQTFTPGVNANLPSAMLPAGAGGGGKTEIHVTVQVAGTVKTERDLVEAIHSGLLAKQQRTPLQFKTS